MRQDQELAKNIVNLLEDSAETLPTHVLQKLEESRKQAVVAHSAAVAGHAGLGEILSQYLHQRKFIMSAAMMVAAILVAFIVTQQFSGQDALEQGDAFLLGAELPPEAFLDQGFHTWLEETSQH